MSPRPAAAWCVLLLALGALGACGRDAERAAGSAVHPTPGATATEAPCPEDSRCFEFTEDSDGWPEVNDDQHYAGRDTYLDGSYRVGAREPGSWTLRAPLRVSDLSPDYGVQVETDATPGRQFPDTAAWGAACWTRDLGQGRVSGFAVHVQPDVLTVGLYDEHTAVFRALETHQIDGLSEPGKQSHLRLRCTQASTASGVGARIEVAVDGAPSVTVDYDNSVRNYAWGPADGVGLLAAGQGADVFYDHVVVSSH